MFFFSIDKKKKYQVKFGKFNNRICTWRGYSLCLGEELYLHDSFMSRNDGVMSLNDKYGEGSSSYEINNGEGNFAPKQLFVYQVLF